MFFEGSGVAIRLPRTIGHFAALQGVTYVSKSRDETC